MINENLQIDDKLVEELKGLLGNEFNNFINVYLQDFEKKERDLIVAIESKDKDKVMKIAHILKGSSLSVGAIGLGNACTEIENAEKKGSFEDIANASQKLRILYPLYKAKYLQLATV